MAAVLVVVTAQAQIYTPSGDVENSLGSGGNIGVGAETPMGKLHVHGHGNDTINAVVLLEPTAVEGKDTNDGLPAPWIFPASMLKIHGRLSNVTPTGQPDIGQVFNVDWTGATQIGDFPSSPSNMLSVRNNIGVYLGTSTWMRLRFEGTGSARRPQLSWRASGNLPFQIRNDETNTTAVTLSKDGKVGVGTEAFAGNHNLFVNGGAVVDREMYIQKQSQWGEDDEYIKLRYNTWPHLSWESSENKNFEFYGNGNRSMVLSTEGKVGIGTAHFTGDHSLYVDGSMIAEEAFIKLKSTWPDYVFQPDYHLMPLDELGTYIGTNGRLPGMPSAAQVAEEGAAIGENQRLLTEKVEELTLYLLEMSSRLRSMTEQYDAVNEEMKALREEITTLRGEK